jgi:hypothetical protein
VAAEDYVVFVNLRPSDVSFALSGAQCPLGAPTLPLADPSQWHRLELYINVIAGTAVVVVDGVMTTFNCQPGFAGEPNLMRTELGAVVGAPHAACDVEFDDVMIK